MAYATGTAADLQSLLTAIRDFAVAQGWTVDKFVPSATPTSNLLFLRKGLCFVTMQGGTQSYSDYSSGSAVASTDIVLRSAIGTAITVASTTFFGHPGSLVTTVSDTDQTVINDLAGPFNSYHLFADATVSDHIHVVIQCAAERWQHFSFGHLDKGTFTHAGVAYVTGASRAFNQRTSGGPAASGNDYNEINSSPVPFAGKSTFDSQLYGHAGYAQFYLPDALPNNPTAWPVVQATGAQQTHVGTYNKPSEFPSSGAFSATNRLLDAVILNPATQWAGNVMLWAIPVVMTAPSLTQLCYVGDFPNVRVLNMEGLTPQQEIALGSDVWKVFPAGRQTSWGTKTETGDQFASGHYAVAYKKVI